MRSGGFTVQQPLSIEAATVIKQSVTLARRRGHAQVTPLHVASTMLSSPTGLLRTACLQAQSHSHPLQCKALELCFNVALNRLPASSSGPIFGSPPPLQHPSISNALVAAFKRAQAHQRRGATENQQQPLLTVKIEIEQLIISILDDPSVSRVMREAGFSSTQVKSNVEQSMSLELCSNQTPLADPITNKSREENDSSKFVVPIRATMKDQIVMNEDVMSVIDNLINKRRRRLVIVGEYVDSLEGVVRGVMEKVEEEMKGVKFISFPLFTYGNLTRGEVERKIGELRDMKGYLVDDEGVIVLYLGDLKCITEYRVSSNCTGEQTSVSNNHYYCPVEHMIVEVGKLVENIGRFWLLGIASFQTYSRCRNGNPSLESVWRLQPLTLPTASLGLSLVTNDSNIQKDCASKKSRNRSRWLLEEGGEEIKDLTCCADCSVKFQSEAQRNNVNSHGQSTSSNFPPWLRDDYKRLNTTNDQEYVSIKDLCKKWNSICSSSSHRKPHCYEKTITISSPSSSTSCFSYDQQNPNSHNTSQSLWTVFQPPKTFSDSATNLSMYNPENGRFFNPNSTPNSASSSNIMEMEYTPRFKEFNAENLKTLSNALEKKVPWKIDIIPEIVGTILQCRSGMLRRKEKRKQSDNHHQLIKEETWFIFQGVDHGHSKDKVARELAKVVFGSHSELVSISTTENLRNKTKRDDHENRCSSYIEEFAEAVSMNPHRIFFVEDVAQADYCSQMTMLRAIETGKIKNGNGDDVGLCDAIIILSCQSYSSRSRVFSTSCRHKSDDIDRIQEKKVAEPHICSPRLSLDLNMSFDDDGAEHMSIDDIGLVESVDRCIIFKM